MLPGTPEPHLSNHALNNIASTSCTYSDGTSSVCNTVCNVNVSAAGMLDNGDVTGFCHKVDKVIRTTLRTAPALVLSVVEAWVVVSRSVSAACVV